MSGPDIKKFLANQFQELPEGVQRYVEEIEAGTIPRKAPHLDRWGAVSYYEARSRCIHRGCWVVVDQTWTKNLAKWIGSRRVLEIMAGGGWIAKALHDHGVDVIATDNFSWGTGERGHNNMPKWDDVEVRKVGAFRAVKTIPSDVLLVSWVPYEYPGIVRICDAWGTERPIVYIGESSGGCTACDKFYERFEEDETAPRIAIEQWPGIHDELTIGYWKGGE